ncbi:hypothetical protein EPH_0070910 [Eimeria praecox]|uniref:Uncharacterized protein n=1 Tax=Eimeria praecox TaxID=51316 RepID=U6H5N4_9EIME|nr:hypothetical protein EPH_0070910 [Eimeria praecox]
MHLRDGKVLRPPQLPGSEMSNPITPHRETSGQHTEPKRMEHNRDLGPLIAGEGHPAPRSREHEGGGRKDQGVPYVKLEPEMVDMFKQLAVGIKSSQQRITTHEDGSNMRAFLDFMEQEFLDQDLLEMQ